MASQNTCSQECRRKDNALDFLQKQESIRAKSLGCGVSGGGVEHVDPLVSTANLCLGAFSATQTQHKIYINRIYFPVMLFFFSSMKYAALTSRLFNM